MIVIVKLLWFGPVLPTGSWSSHLVSRYMGDGDEISGCCHRILPVNRKNCHRYEIVSWYRCGTSLPRANTLRFPTAKRAKNVTAALPPVAGCLHYRADLLQGRRQCEIRHDFSPPRPGNAGQIFGEPCGR
ncbi:hypothetical protein GGR57DRAFT_86549 [Xylariaceae sp. FL1272]|nr:hypothetical protein GGR57DRAFT_86549 [Xylariaceae sp. FL1272]